MPTINQLSAVDQINDGDQFPLYSPNAGDARKASFTTVKESLAGDFASLADLAAQTGAGLVGTSDGTTVQQELDAKVSATLDTDGTLAANSDARVASQKATKTYADTKVAIATLAASGTGQGSDLISFHPDIAVTAPDWPGYAPGLEPNAAFSVLTRNTGEGGIGKAGVYSFMVNGTGNMVPFSTVGGEDCVPVSAVVYSGEDAPHPVCATNIVSRYAGLPPGINWGLEIDMNNESATAYSTGDARGGQAVVLNTGSTYSPDTGIVVQRSPGEGTGPGWKQGMLVKGVREAAFVAEAMSSATAPGMSPPATGTLAALVARVGGDAHNRFTITESGQMYWGSGSAFADVTISRSGAGTLTVDGSFNASLVMGAQQYWVGANPVVGARKTGWGAPSGTATRTTFDTTTVTTAQLAERVKALIDDLTAHGLIGA